MRECQKRLFSFVNAASRSTPPRSVVPRVVPPVARIMKQALCVQHVPFEGPGVFRRALEQRHHRLDTRLVPRQGLPDALPDFLLVMGGPMSVNDPDPWIEREQRFIRRAIDAGIPVVGVCLGAQFLAKALGGQVTPGPHPEIGPTPVTCTATQDTDPVFGTFPRFFTAFQWHGEGLTLPPRTVGLASSERYPVQAFRYGARTYGLLFHLELEREGIEALCRECSQDIQRAGTTAEAVLESAMPILPPSHQLADRLVAHLAG